MWPSPVSTRTGTRSTSPCTKAPGLRQLEFGEVGEGAFDIPGEGEARPTVADVEREAVAVAARDLRCDGVEHVSRRVGRAHESGLVARDPARARARRRLHGVERTRRRETADRDDDRTRTSFAGSRQARSFTPFGS